MLKQHWKGIDLLTVKCRKNRSRSLNNSLEKNLEEKKSVIRQKNGHIPGYDNLLIVIMRMFTGRTTKEVQHMKQIIENMGLEQS